MFWAQAFSLNLGPTDINLSFPMWQMNAASSGLLRGLDFALVLPGVPELKGFSEQSASKS